MEQLGSFQTEVQDGGTIRRLRKQTNDLEASYIAKQHIISEENTGFGSYQVMYAKERLNDEKKSIRDATYQNIVDFSNRGLSWNIAFLDNVIREESYVENAIVWRANKALQNGIDLNIRDAEVDISKTIGVVERIKSNHTKALFDFSYLGIGYGGSGALIVVNGNTDKQEMLKPLTSKDVKKGDTLSLRPLTRLYQIQPDYSKTDRYINKVGKDVGIYDETELGKPQYYRVSISGGMFNKGGDKNNANFDNTINTFIVHRSRLLVSNGSTLTWIEQQVEQFFGRSIVENAIEEIKKYKKTLEEIMKLLSRSNLPVINMAGLEKTASRSGSIGISKINDLIDAYTYALEDGDIFVVGAKDEEDLRFIQAEFKELSNILLDRKKELSSSLKAPLSVTFKEKDELDENEHFYAVKEFQTRQLAPALRQLIPLEYKSLYGEDIPEYSFVFRSLEETSEKDKIDKLKTATEIITDLFEKNLITSGIAHKMLYAASNNVNDMFYEIDKEFKEEYKDMLFKDFQIEIANELNWNNKKDELNGDENKHYNMAETKLKGRNEGGDPKTTKKIGIDL